MPKTIFLLNGPNLNLLGQRQPEIYGKDTLEDVARIAVDACEDGYEIRPLQSNSEGQLVTWVQEARDDAVGIVLNAGALTHTSIALRDAVEMFDGPTIEVHISNVHARESFRHHSHLSAVASGIIVGFGTQGYAHAVKRICALT